MAGDVVRARTRAVTALAGARACIAYVAHENEVPTAGILADAVSGGLSVYLPAGDGGLVALGTDRQWARGPGGVVELVGPHVATVENPCIALVPLVAWNPAGVRLGRGAGYYDRLFVTLPKGIVRVGLAYEFQEISDLPRDPWDVPVDFVITERRTVRCGAGGRTWMRPAEEEMNCHESV
jgi:5-formyltetrahydrofolate cyclo-ligase